jgi:hypothetical protein
MKRKPADTGVSMPVPESVTVCDGLAASSVKTSEALRAPAAPGVNVAEAVQRAPATREAPQVVVKPKSLALAPESRMLPMLTGFEPMFEKVTVCAALAAPNC